MKIRSFTDLHAWQEGHKLVLAIYSITKHFPDDERYGLSNQMRKCAVSITSNLAEGFSRKSKKEAAQFFYISIGSITELQNQLLIARDVGYVIQEEFKKIADQTVVVSKLTNGLVKTTRLIT